MKIYITKYALTSGIITANISDEEMKSFKSEGVLSLPRYETFLAKYVETTLEGAVAEFEVMKFNKLKNLNRQVNKLHSIEFNIVPPKRELKVDNNLQEAFAGILKL